MRRLLLPFLCCAIALHAAPPTIATAAPPSATQLATTDAAALYQTGLDRARSGNFPAAIDAWNQALEQFQAAGDRDGERETSIHLGHAYQASFRYPESRAAYFAALQIAVADRDRTKEAEISNYLALAEHLLGDTELAIERYSFALEVSRESGDRQMEALALNGLGISYQDLGNYEAALEVLQQALVVNSERESLPDLANNLGNLGVVYSALGRLDRALEYYEEARAAAQALGDRRGEARSLGSLGIVALRQGNLEAARDYFEAQLARAREIGDRDAEINALGSLGETYQKLGDNAAAGESLEQTLALSRELGDRLRVARTLTSLANIYQARQDYEAAVGAYTEWLAMSEFVRANDPVNYAQTLSNIGSYLWRAGDLAAAMTSLNETLAVFDSLRSSALSDADKIALFEVQAQSYRELQAVTIAAGDYEAALAVSERGRARAFADRLEQRLGANAALGVDAEPPDLARIRAIARDSNATLVQYSVLQPALVAAWVVSPEGEINFKLLDMSPADGEPELTLTQMIFLTYCVPGQRRCRASVLSSLRGGEFVLDPEAIAKPDVPDPSDSPDALAPDSIEADRDRRRLYDRLIAPIADWLPADPDARVTFIPHRALYLMPFASLQAPDGSFVIENHTISIAPSIHSLDQLREIGDAIGDRPSTGAPFILGNPTMPPGLKPLQFAEREATAVAALLGVDTFDRKRATETEVKERLPNANLIHLATHGTFDETSGFDSALAFTPSNKDDGYLTAAEIVDLELNAELAVLSACATGRGRITGDGVVGLARSLAIAGVPDVIVSLWNVDDAATAFLMTEFYKAWKLDGRAKAAALRQAMLTTMKEYPDPFFWSAFSLVGHGD